MYFQLFVYISFCKNIKDDPIQTPEAYPLSIPTSMMKIAGEVLCNHFVSDFPQDDLDDSSVYSNKMQLCWSYDGNASFSYTFKGVQFLIYSMGNQSGKFNLIFDDEDLGEIIETQRDTKKADLLYTSKVYAYGNHTIKAVGQKGQYFEILKFAFWPEFKVKRLNMTNISNILKFNQESDKPGIRKNKFFELETYKFWIYGDTDLNYGKIIIMFGSINEIIDTNSQHEEYKLLFESNRMNLTHSILCLLNEDAKEVSLHCVYYLYEQSENINNIGNNRVNATNTNTSVIALKDNDMLSKQRKNVSVREDFSYIFLLLIRLALSLIVIIIFMIKIKPKIQYEIQPLLGNRKKLNGLQIVDLNQDHDLCQGSNKDENSDGSKDANSAPNNIPIASSYLDILIGIDYDMIIPQNYIEEVIQEVKDSDWMIFPVTVIKVFEHEINKLAQDEIFIKKFSFNSQNHRRNINITLGNIEDLLCNWIRHFFPVYIIEQKLNDFIKFFYEFIRKYQIPEKDAHDIFYYCMNIADQVASQLSHSTKTHAYREERLKKDSKKRINHNENAFC